MRALDYQRGAWRPGTRDLAEAGLGRARRFSAGEPVLTNGVSTHHAALITDGLVKVMLPSAKPDKAGILMSIRGPGDLVGEEAAILGEASPTGYGHSPGGLVVTALTDVSARVFPAEQLRRYFSEHPTFLWPVAAALCERLADAEARIASAARDNADSRLARLLCDLERHGVPDYGRGNGWRRSGTRIPLNLSHAELASWVGSCRETVDRIFARWRARGIVSNRYRTIVVHDLETLARIAGIQIRRRAWNWQDVQDMVPV